MLTLNQIYVSLAIEQREVKDQVPVAMPQCFENWCHRFDNVYEHDSQRVSFLALKKAMCEHQ